MCLISLQRLWACLHGGGGLRVGEVTRLGGVPACPYDFLFHFDRVYMIGGVTRLGGLPGLPGGVSWGDNLPCKRVKVG